MGALDGNHHGALAHKARRRERARIQSAMGKNEYRSKHWALPGSSYEAGRGGGSKFNTFSITDNAYITYINIGFWKDIESFDAAVGKYIQPPERRKPLEGPNKDKEMLAVYRYDFEFKIRERVILEKILDRKGALDFPVADLT